MGFAAGVFCAAGRPMFGPGGWHGARFIALYLLWLRLNDALFGMQAGYWHLAAVAAHLLMTLMVYLLVRQLLHDWVPAALTALFFGLHPVHVQVVSWVSVVSESLLGAALLASLLCYITREKSRLRYAGSLIFYAMALLVKETAIVFPVVIFAQAWLFPPEEHGGRWGAREAMRQVLPFAGLSAVYLGVRWAVLKTLVVSTSHLSAATTLFTLPSLLLFYVKLMVWPVGLSPLYSTPLVKQAGAENFAIPVFILLLIGGALAGLLWWVKRAATQTAGDQLRWRGAVFSLVFAVFLLPALNLPALPLEQMVQDRYLYLPSLGFAILLAAGLQSAGQSRSRFLGMPAATAVPALLLGALMAMGSISESRIWASNLTLFTRAAQKAPDSKIARNDLAAALSRLGPGGRGYFGIEEAARGNAIGYGGPSQSGEGFGDQGGTAASRGVAGCRVQAAAKRAPVLSTWGDASEYAPARSRRRGASSSRRAGPGRRRLPSGIRSRHAAVGQQARSCLGVQARAGGESGECGSGRHSRKLPLETF